MVQMIEVFSRREMAERLGIEPDFLDHKPLISINCPEDGPLISGEHPNLLTLFFHDIDQPMIHRGEELVLFSEDQADEILDFLEKVTHDYIAVHCHAGISRSGAVADFAREYFKVDFETFNQVNSQILPNRHVVKLLKNRWERRI